MQDAPLFQRLYAEYEKDPEYIAHGLLYRVVDEICAAMERQGTTRRELAARLDVSPQYVTKFLNTPSNTTLLQLVRFADAVGLTVNVWAGERLEVKIESRAEANAHWRIASAGRSGKDIDSVAAVQGFKQGGATPDVISVLAA